MLKNVLITGASGLLGTRLTELLMQKGYQVSHLSRSKLSGPIKTYQWDVNKGEIDPEAIRSAEAIIHLAGAGIADKRWSKQRKQEIIESRTKSSELLFETLKHNPNMVKLIVSASAIGVYGYGGSEKLFTENSKPANDFLAKVVKQWELSVDKIAVLGIRVAKIRIGLLLSEKGGALHSIVKPIKWGIGSPLGTGGQHMSWIHVDDVCRIFLKAIEDESMAGVYNAVSPTPVTNQEFIKSVGKVLNRPLWLPKVPGFVLKLLLGEMADLVLKGSKVSANKIKETGFEFLFTDLEKALSDLLLKKETKP